MGLRVGSNDDEGDDNEEGNKKFYLQLVRPTSKARARAPPQETKTNYLIDSVGNLHT